MIRYIIRRLVLLLPVLFGVSILIFVTIRQLPGDPALAILGPRATPEQIEALHKELRLDDPLVVQYFDWLGDAFRGDLGTSNIQKVPVTEVIQDRLPVTIELVLMAMLISIAVGIPSGILSAVKQNTPTDFVARVLNVAALSIPSFGWQRSSCCCPRSGGAIRRRSALTRPSGTTRG